MNKNPLIVSHQPVKPHVFTAQLPEQSPHLLHPGAPAETVPQSAFLLVLLQVRDAVAVIITQYGWKNVPQGTVDEVLWAEQLERRFKG